MKKTMIIAAISAFLFAGCAIGFNRHGNLVVVPALPTTVELDADQYYYQNGYYYHHDGDIWVYSQSRQGPWVNLPRSHYPREVRYRGHEENHRDDRDHRDHDNHDNQRHDR
jgi:hypothetical protein